MKLFKRLYDCWLLLTGKRYVSKYPVRRARELIKLKNGSVLDVTKGEREELRGSGMGAYKESNGLRGEDGGL